MSSQVAEALIRFVSDRLGEGVSGRLGWYAVVAVVALISARPASADTVPLGIASGGIAIYYNNNGGGENPLNQAYARAQFSLTNTNGGQFNFDSAPIPGTGGTLSFYSLFQAVPNQFGLDLVLQAPTSDGSVPAPSLHAKENVDGTPGGATDAGPVTWAINGYTGVSDGPGDPLNGIVNSLFRGGSGANDGITFVYGPVQQNGNLYSVDVSGELDTDGLIHWYTPSTPDSPVGNFELTGKFFFSGTLVYDKSTDTSANLVDFYAGTVQIDADVICGDRYVDAVSGADYPGGIPNNCRNSGSPCQTIQRTVDIACAGETIHVAAGTYPEQVIITKPLTIQGAGMTNTVIAPTAVSANTTSLSSGNPIAAIVLARDTTGVSINDLKVDGAPAAFNACSPGYMGIFYRNASGAIDSTHVTNVYHPSAGGCQAVIGIFAQSGGTGSTSLDISASVIDNYGKNGITCNEAATACNLTGNAVTGRGPVGAGDAAQNGIQIGYGATGSIVSNEVHGNDYTPQSWCATGVLVLSDGVIVQGNTLSGNLCDLLALTSGSNIEGNIVDPAGFYPFSVMGDGNTVNRNVVNGSSSLGVYVDGTGNSFTCNRVTNNAGGGFFFDSSFAGDGSGVGAPNDVHSNAISGNGVGLDASALDPGGPAIDATGNWWGCVAGPGNPGCDTATGNVDSSAPAAAPPACVNCNDDAQCDDGLACNGTETCNTGSNMCESGTPVVCTGDQCNNSACIEPSGTCAITPKIDGFACNDGNACTTTDICQGGVCTGGGGGDADGDGYCDGQETAAGCSPNDFFEIPPQSNVYSGGRTGSGGEILLTFHAPGAREVAASTDPSCAAGGVCNTISGFCTSGAVGDPCTINSDCDQTDTCRVVVNYAEIPDLALISATLKISRQPKADVLASFLPATPGCTRKVDLSLADGFRRARLRLKANGTTSGKLRKDRDVVIYSE